MTVQQALQILIDVTGKIQLNRDSHAQLGEALNIVAKECGVDLTQPQIPAPKEEKKK